MKNKMTYTNEFKKEHLINPCPISNETNKIIKVMTNEHSTKRKTYQEVLNNIQTDWRNKKMNKNELKNMLIDLIFDKYCHIEEVSYQQNELVCSDLDAMKKELKEKLDILYENDVYLSYTPVQYGCPNCDYDYINRHNNEYYYHNNYAHTTPTELPQVTTDDICRIRNNPPKNTVTTSGISGTTTNPINLKGNDDK